ncbi:unnamed protein product, partial [Hapterophycus canaliculatus]
RVWDLVTGGQRYQFSSPADRATCLAYAPTTTTPAALFHTEELEGAGEEERHLAAGYASGAVRVFDVPSTSTMWELKQHRGAVQQV